MLSDSCFLKTNLHTRMINELSFKISAMNIAQVIITNKNNETLESIICVLISKTIKNNPKPIERKIETILMFVSIFDATDSQMAS